MNRHSSRFAITVSVVLLAIGTMGPAHDVAASATDTGIPPTYRTDVPPIQLNSGEAYGLGLQRTLVDGLDWEPEVSGSGGVLLWRSPFDGRVVFHDGSVIAPVHLPTGSEIHQVCFVIWDDSANNMVSPLSLYVVESADEDVSDLMFLELGTTGTTMEEAPGWTQRCISFPAPIVFKRWGDIDDDGTEHYLAYHLRAAANTSWQVALHAAVITWNRTLSPAPATATFPDVPTTMWAFQHVEALAASGITAGCGGGNFCPNNTLTRAEMAVFLAKALGLHWAP